MRKIFSTAIFVILFFAFLLLPKSVFAQPACPSAEMGCTLLDNQGGCQSPCVRVVTQLGGGGGRGGGVVAQCQCQSPQTQPQGSLSNGTICQQDSDCKSGFCWSSGPGQPTTCQPTSVQQARQAAQGNNTSNILVDCPNGAGKGIATAIGCIPIETSSGTIGFILNWAIGIGGGIAFLLILYAGFQIMTSSGDPQKLKAGQELLTAAISGIIMLIFSVFILRFIGVNILGI